MSVNYNSLYVAMVILINIISISWKGQQSDVLASGLFSVLYRGKKLRNVNPLIGNMSVNCFLPSSVNSLLFHSSYEEHVLVTCSIDYKVILAAKKSLFTR